MKKAAFIFFVASFVPVIASFAAGAEMQTSLCDALSKEMWERPVKLRDGVTMRAYALDAPRMMKAYVVKVDLSTPGIGFTASDRDEHWGEPMPDYTNKVMVINTEREKTADFMMRRRAEGKKVEIAVNTSPWGPWVSPYNHKYGYLRSWVVSDGIEISKAKNPKRGAFFVVYKNGKAAIVPSVPPSRTNNVAICMYGFGIIMRKGVSLVEHEPTKLAPRMAVGLSADRKTLVLLAVDGRQPGYSLGAALADLCEIMRGEGATDVINMDGGGSTSLVVFDNERKRPWMLNHHAKGVMRKNAVNFGITFGESRETETSGLVLAERGKRAEHSIVIPDGAGESVRYAAEELRDYVSEMTGVELPIITDGTRQDLPEKAIFIAPPASRLVSKVTCLSFPRDDDSFRIVAKPPNVYIIGGKRGALYGVYELLETYGGIGWYASWRTVVPKCDRFAVPANLDDSQSPAFPMRMTSWFDTRAHNESNIEFAVRLRLNGHRNIGDSPLCDKFGGVPYRFGGGLGACHTFNTLLPPQKHFKDHPEWYSEINGKRTDVRTQLCLTNPEVLRMVTSNVLERIRMDPGATFYGVSQNDWHRFCTCANCAAVDAEEESHAGTMVRFVNAIAESVEREFPGKFIETLAYQYTRKPPKITKLRHNVIPCLCTIECEFNKPFGVSTNVANVSFEKDIKGWAAQTSNLFLWDYTTNFRNYLHVLPNVYTLGPNLKFFRDNGVKYMFEQGCGQGRHADFAELKAWLIAKFEWNPDQPVEPLLDRFFVGYYGAAAPFARQYFEEAQALGRAEGIRHWGIYDPVESKKVPDESLVRATNLWAKAAAAVRGDPILSYNVRMGACSPLYTIASRSSAEIRAWVTRHPERYDWEGARRIVQELQDCRSVAGNIRWIESAPRLKVRERAWEKFLARKSPPEPADSAMIPADELVDAIVATHGEFVKDASAIGGRALKLHPTHFGWTARFDTNRLAYDQGVKYRVRVHVKVDRKKGCDGFGEAFWAGVYDDGRRKGCGSISVKAKDAGDGYQWYDVTTWQPESDQHFWLGPGRFKKGLAESPVHNGVYIDALEISRCP